MTDPRNINLNRLAVFVAVIEAGSMSEAARRIGQTKSVISTHLSRLEAELGTVLVLRNSRHLELTDAGRHFFDACAGIVQQVDAAVAALDRESHDVRGTLRVTTAVDFGTTVITPILVSLMNQYPELKVELIAADRMLDIVSEAIDVAIRLGWPRDSSHTATLLDSFSQWLVAPVSWSEQVARAHSPQDLCAWPFIELSILDKPAKWCFTGPDKRVQNVIFAHRFSISATSAVRSAVMAGGGFAILPDYQVAEDIANRRLLRLLPQWKLPTGGIFAVFPQKRQHRPKKVDLFLEAVRARLRAPRT